MDWQIKCTVPDVLTCTNTIFQLASGLSNVLDHLEDGHTAASASQNMDLTDGGITYYNPESVLWHRMAARSQLLLQRGRALALQDRFRDFYLKVTISLFLILEQHLVV